MKEVDYLVEWFLRFLKNRDLYLRKIKEISTDSDKITVVEKDRTIEYVIVPFTEDVSGLASGMDPSKCYGLVMYNNETNLKAIISAWSDLIKIRNLIVYFINPFSKLEKKWVIYPSTHDRITEKASFKTGLRTMFETVETIGPDELKKIIG